MSRWSASSDTSEEADDEEEEEENEAAADEEREEAAAAAAAASKGLRLIRRVELVMNDPPAQSNRIESTIQSNPHTMMTREKTKPRKENRANQ